MALIGEPPFTFDVDQQAWAFSVQEQLNKLIGSTDVPPQVVGLSLERVYPGILVTWTPNLRAASYLIYRNTTANPTTATIVIQLFDKDNASFFDPTTGYSQSQTLYYWVQAQNSFGQPGPMSAMAFSAFGEATDSLAVGVDALATGTSATAAGQSSLASGNTSTAVGRSARATATASTVVGADAVASGSNSTTIGQTADATGSDSTAVGQAAQATNTSTTAVGKDATATGSRTTAIGKNAAAIASVCTAIGEGAYVNKSQSTAIGQSAVCASSNSVAIGVSAATNLNEFNTSKNCVAIGAFAQAGANAGTKNQGMAIGAFAAANRLSAIALGAGANATADRQVVFGFPGIDAIVDGSNSLHFEDIVWAMSSRGVLFHSAVSLSEGPITIAAAAFTDTTIQIPASVIVKAVTVRTTTVIPTAATYTVTGATTGTVFNTAAVGVAAGSTDKGNAAGAYYNAAAQFVRITPSAIPAANTGRVVVTIIYEDVTSPTS